MTFDDMSLEQIGAQAHAHYKAGEKAATRANDQAKSAGLYLAEAKRRIDEQHPYGERTKVWIGFLAEHCPVKRGRAEQLIAIATGKTTEEEFHEKKRETDKKHRQKKRDGSLPPRGDKVPDDGAVTLPGPAEADLGAVPVIHTDPAEAAVAAWKAFCRLYEEIPNARQERARRAVYTWAKKATDRAVKEAA
jgi:hypothetical protein